MVHKEDLDFMPDTYAAEVESTPVAAHAILWVSVIFLVVAIVWANQAKLDEVTHATGRVIPSGQIQVVQNLEGGILTEVLVKAGDYVTQNQILIRMDDTRFASSFNEGVLTSQILRAKIARLQAEISGDPFESPEGFPAEHMDIPGGLEQEYQPIRPCHPRLAPNSPSPTPPPAEQRSASGLFAIAAYQLLMRTRAAWQA